MSQQEANEIAREAQRRWRGRGMLKVALPTAAALGAGAAIAVGSIPGSDGTITGCYASPTGATIIQPGPNGTGITEPPGALRVIDPSLPVTVAGATGGQVPNPAAVCDPNNKQEETQITWNQKGTPGPTGPQGTAGPQGPAGGQGGQGAPGSPLIGGTSFGISGNGKTFLKLDGIKGESTDHDHKGEIEVDSFALSAQGGAQASGGGGGAGKVTISSFSITKTLDKASPLLFQAAATGKHLKEAVLSFTRKAGGKEQTYLKFDFQGILISGVQDGASQKAAPTEQVTLNFQKCKETFIDSHGRVGQTVNINVGNTLKL